VLGVGAAGPTGEGVASVPIDTPSRDRGAPPALERPASSPPVRSLVATEERDAWAILAAVHGLGPVGFAALLDRYGSGVAILREVSAPGGAERIATRPPVDDPNRFGAAAHVITWDVAKAIAMAAQQAGATLERIGELGLKVVTMVDPAYPDRLAAIDLPPPVLYLLGDPVAMSSRAAVAVVGTRRPTDSGRSIAARLGANLAAVGASVISGLAVGIDGAAHAAALHAHGTTVAVIGSGHAILHPRAHSRLAALIVAAGGAVVSELGPDVVPSKGTFPRRNRIISGLADATVVVEAPARSGALITASWALDQGRDCFLVPGAIDAPASAGCLAFLREFPTVTRIVTGIPQLIDDLGLADHLAEPRVRPDAAATLADVGAAAGRLGRELLKGRTTVDELVAATGWPVASVLAGLTLLERRGLAVGVYGRFRPAGALAGADRPPAGQRPRIAT
jgi:DNA processing protein